MCVWLEKIKTTDCKNKRKLHVSAPQTIDVFLLNTYWKIHDNCCYELYESILIDMLWEISMSVESLNK